MPSTTENERWDYINRLDEELLLGGVILPEWCAFIVQQADRAIACGLFLPAILTAVAAVETYLRGEAPEGRYTLAARIETAPLPDQLRTKLHQLRGYRNKWVHVDAPWDDTELLAHPESAERELEEMAFLAIRTLRSTLYSDQWP